MPNAIQMVQHGDPDVLQWREIDLPALQPTEVRVRTIAAAVNRADLEIRQGNWQIVATYPFPYTPAPEVIGDVQEIGHQVNHVKVGDRRLLDSIPARSVNAVFESIGQATFADSVAVLNRGGHLCLVGAASGEHLCFTAWDLLQDLHLTGYSSENLTGAALKADMQHLCQWLASGQIVAPAHQTFPLSAAASVHLQMENRTLTGRSLLVP